MAILFDFDEVIVDINTNALKYINERLKTNYVLEDLKTWDFYEQEAIKPLFMEYLLMPNMYQELAIPNKQMIGLIKQLIESGEKVYIVTASVEGSHESKERFILENMPFFDINNVFVINSSSKYKVKSEVLNDLQLNYHEPIVLVDDGVHNILDMMADVKHKEKLDDIMGKLYAKKKLSRFNNPYHEFVYGIIPELPYNKGIVDGKRIFKIQETGELWKVLKSIRSNHSSRIAKKQNEIFFYFNELLDVYLAEENKNSVERNKTIQNTKYLGDYYLSENDHKSFLNKLLEVSELHNENELFPSLKDILSDEELKEKFLWMYEQSLPFACIKTHGKTIFITHAPCYNKYIGKLDSNSQKYQRNFYFSSRDKDSMVNDLSFMKDEEKFSHPLHVFGHVAHGMKQVEYKNKVWLDTGSVYGNLLTALIIDKKGNRKYVNEKTSVIYEGDLFFMQKLKKTEVKIEEKEVKAETKIESKTAIKQSITDLMDKYNLSVDARYWLHSLNEAGAEFISGTMSPSKASETQLEPIETALDYFYSQGIEQVIIEPKYMGSRLQVYLFRDSSKDFAITRSGHKVGYANEMKKVFEQLHQKFDNETFWKEKIIFDGELLPWSLIAKDLIDKEFLQYGESVKKELTTLQQDKIFNSFEMDFKLNEKSKMIETFLEQAHWFGQSGEVQYKPFSILKVDNEIWIEKNQEAIFTMLNNDPYLVIDTSRESYVKARDFFEKLTQKINDNNLGNEGVVMKPLIWKKGVAPYMKVRNEKYLHLIYGYDYQLHYDEKLKSKRIGKKLELSIKEYELGIEMLKAPSKSELLSLACQINFEIDKEKDLDVRL